MKKFTNVLWGMVIIAFTLTITSCSQSFYQVYEVKSENMKQEDNSLVYENEDCRVMYNLWSEDGKVSFIFRNKTDKDIFVNLGQTFFIVNDLAHDYYNEATTSIEQSVQSATSFTNTGLNLLDTGAWPLELYSYSEVDKIFKKSAFSKRTSIKEQEIICVPAKSYKVFSKCSISPSYLQVCIKNVDYPKKSANVKDYTYETTPLKMFNRIAYGFTKNEVADKHIENNFWVSNITNYSKKAILEKKKVKTDCYSEFDKNVYTFKIGGPNKFYVRYNKNGI